jgi:molecular chaperone DnaK
MKRSTVDFGIDLGTTNSSIALCNGTSIEVIKNEDNAETTPSAVWMDAKGRLYVGRVAKDKVDADPGNAHQEFKRQMGKSSALNFKSSGRKMLPEELSAEVLKELRKSVSQNMSEEIGAAVITVPADFDSSQVEATNRAAEMAGFRQSVMLMEPVAAAMAYGFDKRPEKSRWLVYDFGGGTFDAAVIQVRDGIIQVRDHAGDKMLGGKDIDHAIIDKLLAPAVSQQLRLSNFQRGQEQWRVAFAKLKIEAEKAKIRLSRAPSAVIHVSDIDGRGADFDFELSRPELESLAAPLILRSIALCRDALRQNSLGAGDVDRLLLVGGPTLMPLLRQMLADEKTGLGIQLEYGVDPFSVVARGAAAFAATQPLDLPEGGPVKGEFHVKLDYSAIGPETDPQIVGQVIGSNGSQATDFSRYTVELINTTMRPTWRSGKLGLTCDGRFMGSLLATEGAKNMFQIELLDGTGNLQRTTPENFPYSVNTAPDPNPPLIHDIGIALADNTIGKFFSKGDPLPKRCRQIRYTSSPARVGEANVNLQVTVLQGNYPRADRNVTIGSLDIPVSKLKRDLPAGTEVEVTLEMDVSRRIKTTIFIPVLGDDGEFSADMVQPKTTVPHTKLAPQVKAACDRLDDLRKQAQDKGDPQAQALLADIDREGLPQEVTQCTEAARTDEDAADRADALRRDLDAQLDEVETSLAWPKLVGEAQENMNRVKEVIELHGDVDDKRSLRVHLDEVQEAIRIKDKGMLTQRLDQLDGLKVRVLMKRPEFWVAVFYNIEEQKATFGGNAEALALFAEGRRAIVNSNTSSLEGICRKLWALEPSTAATPGNIGLR